MSANAITINVNRKVRVKGIALPTEHGAWGFLFEPIVAATAVAFSGAGLWVALAVVGAFLTRQPLKILLADWQSGRNLPQTQVALKFTLGFGALAALGFAAAIASTADHAAFLPFALVLPFAVYQIYCDATRKSRALWAELTGALAISSSSAAIALAAGWTWAAAFALWAIFAARLVPSILYVRNRLRLEKGKDFSFLTVAASNALALFFVAALAASGFASKLTAAMFVVLAARAVVGVSPYRRKIKAMRIGVYEVVYGTLTVLSIILGYYLKF